MNAVKREKNILSYRIIMIESLADLIAEGAAPCPSLPQLLEKVDSLQRPFFWYNVCVTFKSKFRVPKVKGGYVELQKNSPIMQFKLTKELIGLLFNGFVYFGVPEWTERGVIHYHMIVAHPLIHVYDSLVRTSIHDMLRRKCGPIQYVQPVKSMDDTLRYMMKEYHSNSSNYHVMSNTFKAIWL